jgi:hypothetical protein
MVGAVSRGVASRGGWIDGHVRLVYGVQSLPVGAAGR